MKSTAKAISVMRELKDQLGFRLAGSATIDTIREAFDTNGFPMLFLSDGGTETASSPVIVLRVKAVDAVSKDIFGNSMYAYAPHALEFAYELDGSEGEPSRLDIMTVLVECGKLGIQTLVKEIADGTAVDETSIDAASATKVLEFDVKYPLKGI